MSCSNTIQNNRGSAIMLVMAIGAVVTYIVFSWVAFSVRRSHSVIDTRDRLNARYAAESVVSKALYERMINPQGPIVPDSAFQIVRAGDSLNQAAAESTLVYIDSLHHSEASATLHEEGSYVRVEAAGRAGKATWDIVALFGQEMPPDFKYALILSVQNKPLEVRRGRIVGDVKTAQQPAGSIDGKIDAGSIVTLPPVDERKFAEVMIELEGKLSFSDSAETVFQGSQVFDEQTMPQLGNGRTVFVNGHVLISGGLTKPISLKGPGTILATGDIQISGAAAIEDVECIAVGQVKCFDACRLDKVTIYSQQSIYLDNEAWVSGNLYAFKTITCAGQSTIALPSFAYIKGEAGKDPRKNVFGLQLLQQARDSGTFFCAAAASYSIVERDARFTGLLYTRGRLELGGTVFGCVAAFELAESIEDNRNTLAGGTIIRKVLPSNFVIPPAFGRKGAGYRLVSWSETPPSDSKRENADE
jgi:hypothetical protein